MPDPLPHPAGRRITRRSMTLGLGSTLAAPAAGRPLAASAQPSGCGVPAEIGDGWRVAPPQAVSIDSIRLCAMTRWLDELRDVLPAVA